MIGDEVLHYVARIRDVDLMQLKRHDQHVEWRIRVTGKDQRSVEVEGETLADLLAVVQILHRLEAERPK